MKPDTIVTYTVRTVPAKSVAWWKDLACFIFGHRWPRWKKITEETGKTEERYCERCKLLGCRGPAWAVLP